MIEDIDTDVTSVTADLSSIGLGQVALSDSGLLGDMTISDDVWTSIIFHEGLEFGQFSVPVIIKDYWTQVTDYGEITVDNLPPRANSIILSDQSAYHTRHWEYRWIRWMVTVLIRSQWISSA